jgi:hypothetical protein
VPGVADDDDTPDFVGGAIPLPPELIAAISHRHDQTHMRAEEREARLFRVLEKLDAESLLAWRSVLNAGSPKTAYAMNQYVDGLVVSQLKYRLGVDPNTGEDPMEKLLREQKQQQDEDKPEG